MLAAQPEHARASAIGVTTWNAVMPTASGNYHAEHRAGV
jgi:hypothetical protein